MTGARRWAAGVAIPLWIVTLALGATAGLPFETARQDPAYIPWEQVPLIFGSNILVGLILYAGVATLGTITIAMTVLAGIYIGSVVGLAVSDWGVGGAADALLPFLAFEVAGFAVFSFAGLLPTAELARRLYLRTRSGSATWRQHANSLSASLSATLPYALLGTVLLIVGAILEVAGGLPR